MNDEQRFRVELLKEKQDRITALEAALAAEKQRADEAERLRKNAGAAAVLAIELKEQAEAKLAAVERERDRWEWVLDYVLGQARAVDLYYDVPEARVGDVDDVKRCLLARYDAAHPAPEEEADRG